MVGVVVGSAHGDWMRMTKALPHVHVFIVGHMLLKIIIAQ